MQTTGIGNTVYFDNFVFLSMLCYILVAVVFIDVRKKNIYTFNMTVNINYETDDAILSNCQANFSHNVS